MTTFQGYGTGNLKLKSEINKYKRTLASIYEHKDNNFMSELLLASEATVIDYTYDNWDGGQYYYTLELTIAVDVFSNIIEKKEEIEKDITKLIGDVISLPDEFISRTKIVVDSDFPEGGSGAARRNTVDDESLKRIWGDEVYFRLFLSHKAEYKTKATELKSALELFGISCFVAHEDIEPTLEWQNEIETALFSMDALVALMTENFSDSKWTDQEIGVAIGRGVLVLPVRLGKNPYGFIGKYQAFQGERKKSSSIAKQIFELLLSNSSTKKRMTRALVQRFANAECFDQANTLVRYIEEIQQLPEDMIEVLEDAPNNNSQVRGANAVKRDLPRIVKRLKGRL